jgi:GH24 family phage-related lysozyme (muramidase)
MIAMGLPSTAPQEKWTMETKRYYGDDAVNAAAKYYGQKIIDPAAAHLIREEGFVPGVYKDDKGIDTEGVGLTKEFIGKNFFTEVMPVFEARAREKVKGYDSLPDEPKAAILSAVYRGDLGPKTAELLNAGKPQQAAKEYLNHKEYRMRKKKNPDDGVVKRMERNAEAIAQIKPKD